MAIAAEVVAFGGETIWRPIPMRDLSLEPNEWFSLESLRTRSQVALFVGHDLSCRSCRDYAAKLSAQTEALSDADATPVVVLGGENGDQLAAWRRQLGSATTVALDQGSGWKQSVFDAVGHGDAEVGLVMLDRFGAPRAGRSVLEPPSDLR
jgi:hypothetical protein